MANSNNNMAERESDPSKKYEAKEEQAEKTEEEAGVSIPYKPLRPTSIDINADPAERKVADFLKWSYPLIFTCASVFYRLWSESVEWTRGHQNKSRLSLVYRRDAFCRR